MNLISTIKGFFNYFTLYAGGGGSSAPTQQNVTQTSIPEYARPYVETALGKTAALTDINQNPYQPYTGQQVAGLSPLQQQAIGSIGGQQVASQLGTATDLSTQAGQGGLAAQQNAMGLQGTALGYGQAGSMYGGAASQFGAAGAQQAQNAATQAQRQASMYGSQGAQYGGQGMQYGAQGAGIGAQGVEAAQQGFGAGARYEQQATSANEMGKYMSPYMQNVVDVQTQEARRQADIARQGQKSQAVGQGAFGGSRSAIVQAEADRNLATQLGAIQAQGSQSAYDKAQQAQQFGANLGLQGLQAGYQGLQTGMAGTAQGIQGAQAGMQGAGLGLQGVGQQIASGQLGLQGAQTGIQGQEAGMRGAQTGLSGVNAATGAGQYGLQGLGVAGSAASTLGALGQTQYGQQMGISQAQMQAGGLQQAQEQRGLDVAYQQYQDQLNYPYKQLAFQSDMFRGLPLSQSATTMYQNTGAAAPQLLGTGIAAYGATQRVKNGGTVKSYAEGGMTTVDPSVPSSIGPQALSSRLAKLSDEQLMAYARTVKDAVALAEVKGEIQRRQEAREPQGQMPTGTVAQSMMPQEAPEMPAMAGGGIVALRNGGTGEQSEFSRDVEARREAVKLEDERAGILRPLARTSGPFGYFTSSPEQRAIAGGTLSALQNAPIEDVRAYRDTGVLPGSEDPISPQQMDSMAASQAREAERRAEQERIRDQGRLAQQQTADSQVQSSARPEDAERGAGHFYSFNPSEFEDDRVPFEMQAMQDADSQVQPTGTAPSAAPGTSAPAGTPRVGIAAPGVAPTGQAPVAGAPAAPAAAPSAAPAGIVPSSKAPAAMAGGAVPIPNAKDPMGWGAYKANVDDMSKLDPEQKAVLDDMRKRTERKMSRAEKQEKNIMSDTMVAMGVAAMGGMNIPDAVRRMAAMGGQKYFESSAAASKAIEAADDAQSAFDQYQLSLKQGNKKVAADMYGKYFNSMMDYRGKIDQASISAAASMANAQAQREATAANREMQEKRYDLDREALMQRHAENIEARKDDFKVRMQQSGDTARYQQMQLLDGRQKDLSAEMRATEEGVFKRFKNRIDPFEFKLSSGKPLSPADQKAYDALAKEFEAEVTKRLTPLRKQQNDIINRKGELMDIPAPSFGNSGGNSGFRVVGVR